MTRAGGERGNGRQTAVRGGGKRQRGKGGSGREEGSTRGEARCRERGDGERGFSQPPTIASRAKIRAARPYAPRAVDALDCRFERPQIPESVRDFAPDFHSARVRFFAAASGLGVCAPAQQRRSAGAIAGRGAAARGHLRRLVCCMQAVDRGGRAVTEERWQSRRVRWLRVLGRPERGRVGWNCAGQVRGGNFGGNWRSGRGIAWGGVWGNAGVGGTELVAGRGVGLHWACGGSGWGAGSGRGSLTRLRCVGEAGAG